MKNYFMRMFEVEEGEFSAKEVLAAGSALLFTAAMIGSLLFV